jgi:nucleotide-binding universal stress UspA family protein
MARLGPLRRIPRNMPTDVIVSYDGTSNDDDALALGKLLAGTGAMLALAYVRHSNEFDPRREELAAHDAARRLAQGASLLGDPEIPRHVVVSPSTGEGLARLAAAESAKLIVFGSDYRTPPGRAEPGQTAQTLLEGGPVAIGVAVAGLRALDDAAIRTISVSSPAGGDNSAQESAQALATALGATIVAERGDRADLIVVGSQAGTVGRVTLAGPTRALLGSALGSVIAIPHGRALSL